VTSKVNDGLRAIEETTWKDWADRRLRGTRSRWSVSRDLELYQTEQNNRGLHVHQRNWMGCDTKIYYNHGL